MSQTAVKKMIATARARGYITYDELNEVLPPDQVTSEQIEDVMAMLSEMGINTIEGDDADDEDRRDETPEPAEDETSGSREIAIASSASESLDRTDDPVRMYLREMGSVELLSREGEIAIAKRIEAGRNTMIAGLCESPLTFQAITIWRDELLDEAIMLRDVIDLETTFSGQMETDEVASVLTALDTVVEAPAPRVAGAPPPHPPHRCPRGGHQASCAAPGARARIARLRARSAPRRATPHSVPSPTHSPSTSAQAGHHCAHGHARIAPVPQLARCAAGRAAPSRSRAARHGDRSPPHRRVLHRPRRTGLAPRVPATG
jgi:hypothetical protein